MASLPKPAIRLSASVALVAVVISITLALLIGNRLDAHFAGGEGAGPHAQAFLQDTLPLEATLPHSLSRGETITTNGSTFATYTLNESCTVSLAENTSLTLQDGRKTYNVFTMLTGRIVASGDCTFVTRETKVNISGTATLVYFSWLDELVVKVIEGSAHISQSASDTFLVSTDAARSFFTLPSLHGNKPTNFSFEGSALTATFYTWSLTY